VNRPRPLVQALSIGVFGLATSMGCNALLANEEGSPRAADAGSPVPEASAPLEAASPVDAGGFSCDTTQGNKVCFGLCVKISDPNTGCGGASCAGCDPKNVDKAACTGTAETLSCGYSACSPGFASCDGQPANGCETSLNSQAHCGSCTTTCQAPTPLCAVTSGLAACVNACPAGTTECTGACVDTSTSILHCGGCEKPCSRPSASATCDNGMCKFTCNAGTHPCGPICASDLDPMYCGTACVACPPPAPNMASTCTSGTCGSSCDKGYLDCDRDPSNGCETKADLCPVKGTCNGQTCLPLEQCCGNKCIPQLEKCFSLPPAF
jgi:hypothetical protein